MSDRLADYIKEAEGDESGQGRENITDEVRGIRAALRTSNGRKMFAAILNDLYHGRDVVALTPDATHALAAIQQRGNALATQLKDADPDNFWLMLKEQNNA